MESSKEEPSAEKTAAYEFLASLLNKNLRVHTTDERMFRGEFKCTDPVRSHSSPAVFPQKVQNPSIALRGSHWRTKDRNVVLVHTYEYRQPSPRQLQEQREEAEAAGSTKVVMDMTSRYLGLVIVPGEHITKIEVEEFASQMK